MALTTTDVSKTIEDFSATPRARLYGMCVVITLSFLLIGRVTNEVEGWVQVYLPLAAVAMLVMSLAGAEFHLYVERLARERAYQEQQLARTEQSVVERQRAFNRIWQDLADTRDQLPLAPSVLQELAELFAADLTTVWVAAPDGDGYRLKGVHSQAAIDCDRLDKIGQVAPCFDRLKQQAKQIRITDFRKQAAPALAWFCDDEGLQYAVFNPVLVRRELVGVLAFFYRERPSISSKQAEEMQSAANLLLLTV